MPHQESIGLYTSAIVNRDAAWLLAEAFRQSDQASTWAEIAAAMVAVDCLVKESAPVIEPIWSGPVNARLPIRRIEQVLYDLVAAAQRQIVLVTFAAHRVPHLCAHLKRAVDRGVRLTLIVESEGESEGQLTFDAINAFRDVPAARSRLFYWPLAHRERNQAGRPGKLHAKAAIVDDVALIGSANLTEDAFNRNMELGLLVRDRVTVHAVATHFEELIRRGILVQVTRP